MAAAPREGSLNDRDRQEIARLNDWLRTHLSDPGHNQAVMTPGVARLIGDAGRFQIAVRQKALLQVLRDYDDFPPDMDPYGEHDFGAFEFDGTRCFWKIDYFDPTLTAGAENPADASATVRVLTILRADEW